MRPDMTRFEVGVFASGVAVGVNVSDDAGVPSCPEGSVLAGRGDESVLWPLGIGGSEMAVSEDTSLLPEVCSV